MHTKTTETKVFKKNVAVCEHGFMELDDIYNDAYLSDDEKLALLQGSLDEFQTHATPFLAIMNKAKQYIKSIKGE
ncbi:hypothetical protein ACM26M_02820 [Kluyvera cryocrescens]|uniref:hypothetical protein n=1 Tax=Kluyvera cryocrescens TaxID=580 RepID=UPI0039F65C96